MSARHAILGILMQEPLHGYEIDAAFDRGLRRVCHLTISQIYAYLKSMEERGWVEGELIMQKSNPPKKVFHVTARGRQEMQKWLQSPLEEERPMRDALYTKIHFCATLTPERLPALVEEQLEILEAELADVEAEIAGHEGPPPLFLEAKRRHLLADCEWLRWVQVQPLAPALPALA